jgi:regulator of protease activity HflC (stomatin/prohibitin superfamily)
MNIEMTVQYQVDKSHVKDIATTYRSLEALESRINSVVIERTKSVLSRYNADSIISDRASVSAEVATVVEEASGVQYFIDITNVALTNIDFSDAYEASVEQSMIAKQEVEKAKAEAEKLLVEAQNKVAIAEAEANAKKAAANGEAEATKIAAEAEAQALATIQAAWDAIAPEVKEIMLREMAIEKWDGKLPDTMVGSDFLEQLLGALNSTNP